MEQINRIELRGLVGMVRLQETVGKKVAHFTLATSSAFNDRNGSAVIDTQWHNVSAWEGKNITGLEKIKKGSKVKVIGRVRYNKYTGADGIDRVATDIVASKLEIISSDETLQYEM